MNCQNPNILTRFGFSFEKGGAHTARTFMVEDLEQLLLSVPSKNAQVDQYISAIIEDNCLGKRSKKTRELSARHLIDLYSLNPSIPVFRTLLFFWENDANAHILLALLCSYIRDPLLRMSAPFILSFKPDEVVTRVNLEEYLEEKYPNRFSPATLKSTAQNINGTWTRSGHLVGKTKKIRTLVKATPGSVSYALYLGYISGYRGNLLFSNEFCNLLDSPSDHLMELAEVASQRGWIVFKRIQDVVELQFPLHITSEEQGWIYEQN